MTNEVHKVPLKESEVLILSAVAQGTEKVVDEVKEKSEQHSVSLDVINNKLDQMISRIALMEHQTSQLPAIQQEVMRLSSDRKWYKLAAGFIITASASIIGLIIFILSNVSEIAAIKEILLQLIEQHK